jgi:hypothetical protein
MAKRKTAKRRPAVITGQANRTSFKPGQSGNPNGRFKPGQSGNPNGRPIGARHRFSEAFIEAFEETWAKYGTAALQKVARDDPSTFVRAAIALIPKQVGLEIESKPIYVISDAPISDEEWVAKYCEGDAGIAPPLPLPIAPTRRAKD